MRVSQLFFPVVLALSSCGKPPDAPTAKADPAVPAVASVVAPSAASSPAPSAASASASAPSPSVEKLSTAASTTGWKKLDTKVGFTFEYPDKIFSATPGPMGARLTSRLFVDAPHGVVEKGQQTEHRFSARLEIRKEDVVASVRRAVPYAAEQGFPKGTAESFTPSEGFLIKTQIAGRDAYVVLWGAHGYGKRTYFVVADPTRTVTIDFDVITDYLEHAMPKTAKMTEQEQIDVADAVVLSLKL